MHRGGDHLIRRHTPDLDYVEGVIKTSSGMILVHDLDRFLSLEEEIQLDHAITQDCA
jgi:purine-binding chemotaxis protein CheW